MIFYIFTTIYRREYMFKKTASFILLFGMILILTSCSFADFRAAQLSKLMNEEAEKIEEMSEEIIRCLTENDQDGLAELFCEKIKKSEDFNSQIEKVFSFFKCDVYIDSEYKISAGGGSHIEYGEKTEWYVIPEITYIDILVAPDGWGGQTYDRYYKVNYYYMIIDKENPELEGLNYFEIELLNLDEIVTVGEVPDK